MRVKIKAGSVEFWAKKREVDGAMYAEVFEFSPYANVPTIAALVDEVPSREDLIFQEQDGIWYAEEDGYVSFLWHPNDGKNHEGYGGMMYKLNTAEGVVKLGGPWSSNSMSVNSKGFGPCIELAVVDKEKAWERGHTFLSGAITIELLLDSLDKFEGLPKNFELFIGKANFRYFPMPVKRSWSGDRPKSRLIEIPMGEASMVETE